MIGRRHFVRMVLSAAAVSPLVDVDRLLWIPGAKTVFLPPPRPSLDTLLGQTHAMVAEISRQLRAKHHRLWLAPGADYISLSGGARGVGPCDYRMGHVVVGEGDTMFTLSDQYHVCIDADGPKRGAELLDWTIRPAARAIADSIVRDGTTVTAALEKPILHTDGDNQIRYDVFSDRVLPGPANRRYDEVVVLRDPVSGIAIRGIHAYAAATRYQYRDGMPEGGWVTRFDVLGGTRG